MTACADKSEVYRIMQRALNQNVVLNQTQTLSVKLLDIA